MQTFILRLVMCFGLVLGPGGVAWAQDWTEPEPGTDTRRDLMDALRPHAEWELGAPVEFVVGELRVSGDLAFAAVAGQRPGGGVIDLLQTPGYQRGTLDPETMDGTNIQALYRRSGETWVAVHHAIGATDVWFSWDPLCEEYRAVISDYCF